MMEKHEFIRSHVPYPELLEPEAVKFELAEKLLGSTEQPQDGVIVTPLDLRRTHERMTPQQILDSVSTHLGVPMGNIDVEPATPDDRTRFEGIFADINTALEDAGSYIRRVLGLTVPRAQVHSKKELVELVLKTTLYRPNKRGSLELHTGYCALLSVAIAVFELQKQESHTLEEQMKYVEDRIIARRDEGTKDHDPLFFAHSPGDTPESINVLINGLAPQCRAKVSMRDKSKDSLVTKYVRKPESSAEAALKDAIGIRIEVDNSRIEDTLLNTLAYFQQHLGATKLRVEDSNLLGAKRLGEFRRQKAEKIPNGENIPAVPDTSPLSADSFRAVKIVGMILVPRADQSNELIYRPIEIMLVEPENKNESGLSSHSVYEFKKLITVMTRLFGGCNENWLIKQLRDIARKEGFRDTFVQNTIDGLQNTGFIMKLSHTPNKKVYAASEVYRRWLRVDGLIQNEKIVDQLMHTLPRQKDAEAHQSGDPSPST